MDRIRFQNKNIEKLINLGYWEWWVDTNEITLSAGLINLFKFIDDAISPKSIFNYLKQKYNDLEYYKLIKYFALLKNKQENSITTIVVPLASGVRTYFELSTIYVINEGAKCIAGSIQEITDRFKYNTIKEKELQFEKKISEIASRFIADIDFQSAISITLSELGEMCFADNVSLIKIKHNSLTNEFEWIKNEKNEESVFPKHLPSSEAKYLIDLIQDKKLIYFQQLDDLPERLVVFKDNLIANKTKSIIIASLQRDIHTIGAVVLTRSQNIEKWDFSDIHMVKMTSLIIGNALKQNYLNKSIQESEKRLKFALLAGNLGTYEIDLKNQVRLFDERSANIYGYPSHTINKLENWFEKNIHPEDLELYDNSITQCLEGLKNFYELEYKIKCRDGQYKWVNDWGIVTEIDNNGEPLKMVGIIQDISQRKNIEKALIFAKEKAEENENLKTAFLANVSHEIRTPMNGISGFAELLYHDMVSDCDKHKYLELIYKNSHRLLALINNILDISKLETNQITLYETPCSVNNILSSVLARLKPIIEINNQITFASKIKLNTDQHYFMADETRLIQILENIVGNAFKFTEKGIIEIKISTTNNDELFFVIKDTGSGISKEFQNILFNRFSQSDFTIKSNKGGSGLGLPISKGLIEAMGGTIWVKSLKGVGTTFYFTIPFKPAEVLNIN